MDARVKSACYLTGSILAISGLIFVSLAIYQYSSQIDVSRVNRVAWFGLIGLIVVYGLANLMLAEAWWNLLSHFKGKSTRLWAIRAYGQSQLAKYVPGNIVHLAGRQALGIAAGIKGWPLAKSTVWELGLLAVGGSTFFVLVLPLFIPQLTFYISFCGFLIVILIVTFILSKYFGPQVSRAYCWQMGLLTTSGFVFSSMLGLISNSNDYTDINFLLISGAFVVSWFIGLVTPGAPAGIGVREVVLMSLLGGHVPMGDLLLAILLSRIITVSGDALFFFMTYFMPVENRISDLADRT